MSGFTSSTPENSCLLFILLLKILTSPPLCALKKYSFSNRIYELNYYHLLIRFIATYLKSQSRHLKPVPVAKIKGGVGFYNTARRGVHLWQGINLWIF